MGVEGSFDDDEYFYMLMVSTKLYVTRIALTMTKEYGAGGDLLHMIRKHGNLDHNVVRGVFAELVNFILMMRNYTLICFTGPCS